jgi:hypothetical protein
MRIRLSVRRAVANKRVKPFAEDVLEVVQRDGERTAVRSSHLL